MYSLKLLAAFAPYLTRPTYAKILLLLYGAILSYGKRLRLDAQLHAFPAPQPKSKRSPKPEKSVRLPSLEDLAQETQAIWFMGQMAWYQREDDWLPHWSLSLVYAGQYPIPIRWVFVRSIQPRCSGRGLGRQMLARGTRSPAPKQVCLTLY